MRVSLRGKNLYIVNKKPQLVAEVELDASVLRLLDEEGNLLKSGKIDLGQSVYASLYCKQLRNITFIINDESPHSVSLIMGEASQFDDLLQHIREAHPALELSEQNVKINGYAASLVEKLQEGIAVAIMDTKEEKVVKCCPACGMQCDPNIPYCMECGSPV